MKRVIGSATLQYTALPSPVHLTTQRAARHPELEPGFQAAPSVIILRTSALDARVNPRIKSGDAHDDS